MNVSRRSFIGGVLATSAGCVCGKGAMPRHRSDYDGVQVGAITYSFRTMKLVKDCTLQHTLDAKLGSIELMASDLERCSDHALNIAFALHEYDFLNQPAA